MQTQPNLNHYWRIDIDKASNNKKAILYINFRIKQVVKLMIKKSNDVYFEMEGVHTKL